MKVIFNCDDFGLTYGATEAIRQAYKEGLVTSASIRVNGEAYDYAKELLKDELKDMSVGLHVNLTDGKPHNKKLANNRGKYKYNFFWLLINSRKAEILKEIEKDIRAQFEIAKNDGLALDHINGEKHIHLIPTFFEIVCRLAHEYNIPVVRIINEPFFLTKSTYLNLLPFVNLNFPKYLLLRSFCEKNKKTLEKYGLKSPNYFYGLLYTDNMISEVIMESLYDAQRRHAKVIEISAHPAIGKHPKDKKFTSYSIKRYTNKINRFNELIALKDKSIKEYLKKRKIRRVSFKYIGGHKP